MKTKTHPKYFKDATIKCACGNEFKVGSTVENISVELCELCHPFYTGEQKLVDTAGRVEKFQAKLEKHSKAKEGAKGKTAKRAAKSEKKESKKTARKTSAVKVTKKDKEK